VFINGRGAHRMGDQTRHCGSTGQLAEGSPNVMVGESSARAAHAASRGSTHSFVDGGDGGGAGGGGGGGGGGVRDGGGHSHHPAPELLAPPHPRFRVTRVAFYDNVPMEANGNNQSAAAPDALHYPSIPEHFHGWGRGAAFPPGSTSAGDWTESHNPDHPVCYQRGDHVTMAVTLEASPVPTAGFTFTLTVTPSVDGDRSQLLPGSAMVTWYAGGASTSVLISTTGRLADELSRRDLALSWSVSGLPAHNGHLTTTHHLLFTIHGPPRDPEPSSAGLGSALSPVTGLTARRLDKLTELAGGGHHQAPAASAADLERIVWRVHQAVNDETPPYFNGGHAIRCRYGSGPSATAVEVVDQWILWLTTHEHGHHHWNEGSCIGHVQLTKTMLAAAGLNTRRGWVLPKTTVLPDGTTVAISDADVLHLDDSSTLASAYQTFTLNGLTATCVLLAEGRPGVNEWENYEGCLVASGRLFPGAIATDRYPDAVRHARRGFTGALDVLRWWATMQHHGFQRRMLWAVEVSGATAFFGRSRPGAPAHAHGNPYEIPPSEWLPVP
jgi:hypothetical protein